MPTGIGREYGGLCIPKELGVAVKADSTLRQRFPRF